MDIVPQLIANSIIAGAIYALVALGFNLIYGATKFFNLAHGVMAAIGGYTVFYFAKTLGWNLYLSAAIGIILAGFIGYFLEKFVYLPLRKKKSVQYDFIGGVSRRVYRSSGHYRDFIHQPVSNTFPERWRTENLRDSGRRHHTNSADYFNLWQSPLWSAWLCF